MALLLAPAFFFFTVLVPLPEYRQGTYADFAGALASCLTLYGGEAIGLLVLWRRLRSGPPTGRDVLRAGFLGGVITIGVVIAGHTLYRRLTGASVSAGNLWGLVVIFGAAFSAMAGGGAGLSWYALRGSNRAARP